MGDTMNKLIMIKYGELSTKKDNDSLILVFENYEISLTGDECLIRPRS